MKIKASLFALMLVSCSSGMKIQESVLQKISLIDQNGLIQIIATKNELKRFNNVNYLSNQPYKCVTRIFSDVDGKKKMTLTSYYPTGSIKEYLEAIDGRAKGKYVFWHENGTKKIEGRVIGGIADLSEKAKSTWLFEGIAKAFDDKGNVEALLTYSQGKLNGSVIHYFPNKLPKHRFNYQMGKKEEWQYSYFANGSLRSKKQFVQDLVDGVSQEFYENSSKKNMELWIKDLLKRGHYFDANGSIISMVQDGKGVQTRIDENGKRELTIENGKVNGKISWFNTQGVLLKYTHEKDGKKHGEKRIFYVAPFSKTSKPKMSIFYVLDVVQGPVVVWYESGQVQAQYEMSENCKHGMATGFYENGSVMYLEQFEKGILKQGKYYKMGASELVSEVIDGSGTATIFDPYGNIEKQIAYDKGHAILD